MSKLKTKLQEAFPEGGLDPAVIAQWPDIHIEAVMIVLYTKAPSMARAACIRQDQIDDCIQNTWIEILSEKFDFTDRGISRISYALQALRFEMKKCRQRIGRYRQRIVRLAERKGIVLPSSNQIAAGE